MKNVMLSLNTVGKGDNAALVSIGAVFFDPIENTVGAEFYQPILLENAVKFGHMDISEIEWWMQQSDTVRAVFIADDRMHLEDALVEFSDWISQVDEFDERRVWSNGATLHSVILANAYTATGIQKPWPSYGDRDVTTIVELGRELRRINPKLSLPFVGHMVNSLHDARHQAKYVSAIYQAFAAQLLNPCLINSQSLA